MESSWMGRRVSKPQTRRMVSRTWERVIVTDVDTSKVYVFCLVAASSSNQRSLFTVAVILMTYF